MATGVNQQGEGESEVMAEFRAICCRDSRERCLTPHELQALRRALQLAPRLADVCGLQCVG